MAVYKFRVTFEEDEDIYREIEVRNVNTLMDFHHALQASMNFDPNKPVILYQSDASWHKDTEIATINNDGRTDKSDVKLGKFIDDPHQRFLYLFDSTAMRYIYIELVKISSEQENVTYPRTVKSVGVAPPQIKTKPTVPAVPLNDDEDDEEEEPEPEDKFFIGAETHSVDEGETDSLEGEESDTESEGEEGEEDHDDEHGDEHEEYGGGYGDKYDED